MNIDEHIRAMVVAIVREEFDRRDRERGAPEFYSQHTAPVGKRRFLDAARAGQFPSSKRGKLVLAKRTDVDAWIAEGQRNSKPANDAPRTNTVVRTVLDRMPKIGGSRG